MSRHEGPWEPGPWSVQPSDKAEGEPFAYENSSGTMTVVTRGDMDGPSSKVISSALTGSAVVVVVYVCGLFGLVVPVEVATGAVVLLGTLVAYLTPERRTYAVTETSELAE